LKLAAGIGVPPVPDAMFDTDEVIGMHDGMPKSCEPAIAGS
jgi:hypothetical protein